MQQLSDGPVPDVFIPGACVEQGPRLHVHDPEEDVDVLDHLAEALLALAQGVLGPAALGHLGPELGVGLGQLPCAPGYHLAQARGPKDAEQRHHPQGHQAHEQPTLEPLPEPVVPDVAVIDQPALCRYPCR